MMKMVNFEAPTKESMELVRQWRNTCLETLRTPFPLTKEQQERFYEEQICSRHSNIRFWTVTHENKIIGLTGFVNISWENRCGEISIMLDPVERNKGYGEAIVHQLLEEGFWRLNFDNIYGECYMCNPAISFWKRLIEKYSARTAFLPNRKYYNGRYWDSLYFNFERSGMPCCK
jgi:RimJ/RimL family protein N-acetyltransferase